jgi:hypothetical protein
MSAYSSFIDAAHQIANAVLQIANAVLPTPYALNISYTALSPFAFAIISKVNALVLFKVVIYWERGFKSHSQ